MCKIHFGLKKSLNHSIASLPDKVFCEPLLELYRNLPGGTSTYWAPLTRDTRSYRELDRTLAMLPAALITMIKRACTMPSLPTSRTFLAERRGIGTLQTYIARLRSVLNKLLAHNTENEYSDDLNRLAGVRDEYNLELEFPSNQFENGFHRGFGHCLNTLENDLCELREMVQNHMDNRGDIVPLVYECRKIARKANLLRWTVNVFLEICVPLVTENWTLGAADAENALISVETTIARGRHRLNDLVCLASSFWRHKTVCSALEKLQRNN